MKPMQLALALALLLTTAGGAATVAPEGSRRAGSRIAAGSGHACAARSSGEVRCWGNNAFGQIGDNTVTERLTPVQVLGLSSVIAIAAGEDHNCALRADGRVRCWGKNDAGQLGDGTTSNRFTPVTVPNLQDVVHVSAGRYHTCAVLVSGEVRCWGKNTNGQLGNGTTVDSLTPVTVQLNAGGTLTGVVEVALGNFHSCAMTYNANIYCWGSNSDGQIAAAAGIAQRTAAITVSPGNAVLLSAGANHTCAVRIDREMRCWGDNANGQVGDNTQTDRFAPVAVASGTLNVTGVSAGLNHTCLLRADATISCWGANAQGQFGDGTTTSRLTPATQAGNLTDAVAIASRNHFNCALLADDRVRCWGGNASGQIGDGTKGNVRLTAVNTLAAGGSGNARQIATSRNNGGFTASSCALRASGLVDCWGRNISGQLGDGTYVDRTTPNPASPVAGLAGVVQVGVGVFYACALRANGTVHCWGNGLRLGDGTGTSSSVPVQVSGISNAVAISVGSDHACAVRVAGSIRCWGANYSGELGDGTTTNRLAPVDVTGMSDAVMVASGNDFTCAVRVQGAVSCWGRGIRLGYGSETDSWVPVAVTGLTDAVGIAAGAAHHCARRTGGSIQCWGSGNFGEVGDGLGNYQNLLPVNVVGISNAVTVGGVGCAILANGSAQCWGQNNYGQIGDGTTTDRYTPVALIGIGDLLSLASGSTDESGALTANGRPYLWGDNLYGQLGDGTTTPRNTPVAVLTF